MHVQLIDPDNITVICNNGLLDRDLILSDFPITLCAKPLFHNTLKFVNTLDHNEVFIGFKLRN